MVIPEINGWARARKGIYERLDAAEGDPRLRQETRKHGSRRGVAHRLQAFVATALSRRRRLAVEGTYFPRIAYLSHRSPEEGFYATVLLARPPQGRREKAPASATTSRCCRDRGASYANSLTRYSRKARVIPGIIRAHSSRAAGDQSQMERILGSCRSTPAICNPSSRCFERPSSTRAVDFQKLQALGLRGSDGLWRQ